MARQTVSERVTSYSALGCGHGATYAWNPNTNDWQVTATQALPAGRGGEVVSVQPEP